MFDPVPRSHLAFQSEESRRVSHAFRMRNTTSRIEGGGAGSSRQPSMRESALGVPILDDTGVAPVLLPVPVPPPEVQAPQQDHMVYTPDPELSKHEEANTIWDNAVYRQNDFFQKFIRDMFNEGGEHYVKKRFNEFGLDQRVRPHLPENIRQLIRNAFQEQHNKWLYAYVNDPDITAQHINKYIDNLTKEFKEISEMPEYINALNPNMFNERGQYRCLRQGGGNSSTPEKLSGSGSGSSVARRTVPVQLAGVVPVQPVHGAPIRANNPLVEARRDPVFGEIIQMATQMYQDRFEMTYQGLSELLENPANDTRRTLKGYYDAYLNEFVRFCIRNRTAHNIDTVCSDELNRIFRDLHRDVEPLLPFINAR